MYPKVKLWDISKITYWKNLPTKLLKQTWYTVFWANWIIGYYDSYLYEDEMLLISCRWAYSWKINMSPKKSFITNNSLIVDLNCKDSIHKKLVYYFLQAVNKTNIITWTAQPQVTINNVLPLEIPLPSLSTQHLIVSEIEKQFSRLDEWLLSLRRAKENLKKYKASVLKSAVEWKLTEDFRKTQKLESANILLEKILSSKELMIKNRLIQKPKEKWLINDEEKNKFLLPENWALAKIVDLAFVTKLAWFEFTKYIKLDDTWEIPVIRAQNVRDWFLDLRNLKYIDRVTSEILNRCALNKKSLLLTFIWAWIWDNAIFDKEERWHLAPNVAKIEPFIWKEWDLLNIKYLNYYLRSWTWRIEIFKSMKATAQPSLSMWTIRDIIVPLPPLSEQNEIVKIVESKLSVVEKLEKLVDENIKRSENLKQSILKKAFEGELVREE